jgi:hypothetical protein
MPHCFEILGDGPLVATNEIRPIIDVLSEAASRDPDLADYYQFHCHILQLLDRARTQLQDVQYPDVRLTDVEADSDPRAEVRDPLLDFDMLPLDSEKFTRLVGDIARVLMEYDHSYAGQEASVTPEENLRLARQRYKDGQVCGREGESTEPPTLAQLSVDLALGPYLEWGAEQLAPYLEVRSSWRQGCCPVCGGAPDFASLDEESGARQLLCSRCNAQWPYPRFGCPFCGTSDHTKITYHSGEDGVHRLYLCEECRRYLKTIDLRQVHRAVMLPAERITTVAMDAAAMEAGYR